MPRTTQHDGRSERSRRTRAQIVAAAERCFIADGYIGTTMEAVAAGAGVAVQTVYYVFGTKPQLLAAVLDATTAGDGPAVAVVERDWVASLGSAADLTSAVADLVAAGVAIIARSAPILDVLCRAASVAEVGTILEENRRRRRADQRHVVEVLAAAGHVAEDVDIADAADVLYALLNEEVFLLLTADCGWTVERFGAWVTEMLLVRLSPQR